jgi:hypothetical protein
MAATIRLSLALLLSTTLAAGCFLQQKIDPEASTELGVPVAAPPAPAPAPAPGTAGPMPIAGGPPAMPGPMAMMPAPGPPRDAGAAPTAAIDCDQNRAKVRTVLETNCAFCHQAPASMGHFDFVLEPDTLTTATGTTGARFVVPGMPDQSRLYQRAAAGEMPPAGRMPRPSEGDIAVLRDWIAACVMMGTGAPRDAGGAAPTPDAGSADVPPPGCGGPGQDCCLGNICNGGGCCVYGQCRGNGLACGDGPGRFGLAGTCKDGSCQNMGNVACGSLTQPCCAGDVASCTAPRATCGSTMTCQSCGGDKQPCCSNGTTSCLAGLGCLDAGFGRVATCQACGGANQRCCGNGPLPARICNAGLKCQILGAADRCAP